MTGQRPSPEGGSLRHWDFLVGSWVILGFERARRGRGWPAELFLDGHRRFAEPRRMPSFQEPRLPARAALVREQLLCPELVLATGG